MEIKNKSVIIAGGASGMGAATAKRLSQQGAKVAILDMNKTAAEKIAADIKGIAIECDVTHAESVEKALATATAQHGPARIVINCAGVVHSKRMVGKEGPLPLDEFRKIIEINLIGTFNVMRLGAAAMMPLTPLDDDEEGGAKGDGERGVIINTASIAAYEGQIGQTAYSASKGGIIALTLPAARELATFGIRIVAIAPGLVDTPLFAKIPAEAKTALAASVPFPKRLAYPAEFAMLVEQIINNPMLNGCVIRLDGALRMQAK